MRILDVIMVVLLGSAAAQALPGDVLREFPAPGKTCTGLAFDGKLLWVADHGLGQLIAVDPEDGVVKQTLKSPGYRPAGLAFDGQDLWNVDVLQARIFRIRPSDGRVTRVVPSLNNPSPFTYPRALAFDGKFLWVSDDDSARIYQLDPLDGSVIRDMAFPGKSVDGMTFDGRYLWVADRLADRFYAVFPETGDVVVTLKTPGPHATGLAYVGKDLVSVDYQTDRISFIRRDDRDHVIKGDPREEWVVFTHQVRNFGPDPLLDLDSYIALPKDLDNQHLLSPPAFDKPPLEVVSDQFDQKVAHFHFSNVPAGQSSDVHLKAHLVAKDVQYMIYPENVQGLAQIPGELRRLYLADSIKYDLKNPVIVKAVAEAVGAERNPYWIARKIYRYVQDKLHYERSGGWDVAPKILLRGSGSCSEYSYLYIALCRAAGIPARYAGSLVVRKDDASYDDVYHRWVEVYLPPYGWIPVDPSRGDKPSEAERADSFGHLTHDFLITTHGGGGSTLLDWSYNSNERYACRGRCRVEVEGLAEWSPEDPDARTSPLPVKSGQSITKPEGVPAADPSCQGQGAAQGH